LPRTGGPPVHFVGRRAERRLLDRLTLAAASRQAAPVLFVTGEAGIGKSHFLARLLEGMIAIKGQAYAARAYEAETARPYGIWIDLLRGIERERGGEGPWQPLGPLLPECGGAAGQPPDRSRLFDAIAALLRHLAAARPLALALDDIQWLDEGSSSLLHYIARTAGPDSGLLLACAARSGELGDNAPAAGILRSLRREGRVQDVHLRPLSRDETAELVRAIDPRLDAARVFAESEGNPLFALTLSRDSARVDAPPHRTTLELVIRGQLAQLKHGSRELLPWAAALGRRFTLDVLAGVAGLGTAELLAALEELERREIVQPVGGDAYDFVHDLLRETAYRSLSQPRRKLLHRQIARFLIPAVEADDGLAGELARHAGLGDDHQVAARACLVAGERCLRLFANAEADGFAERGLRHAGRMPEEPPKVEASIGLLKIRILAAAGPGMRPLPPVREDLAHAVARAEALGLHAASATGNYLLSVLSQEAGDTRGARESTLRAASAGRAAGPLVRARQLANTARCLTELETDIGRARLLVREAEALAGPLGVEICELHWGRGLLQRWDGEAELAAASCAQGLALAQRAEDRWREYKCLTWMAMLELERGLSAATATRCAELMQVAEKLGEGEVPFAMALAALAEAMSGARVSLGLAGALERLRAVDDKSYLAYALNLGATVYLTRGDLDAARARATEALVSAQAMHRRSEALIARATLARVTEAGRAARREMAALLKTFHDRDSVSARARSALVGAAAALGASVPAAASPSQRRSSRLVGR
jgi:hypothetical protein